MSLYSMTGFGRSEASGENYSVTIEIKTVNNRFKDYRFKMPSYLNFLELELRKKLDSIVKRGTFDIFINVKKREQELVEFNLDQNKVRAYLSQFQKALGESSLSIQAQPTDFLRKEFLMDDSDSKEKEVAPLAIQVFDEAIKNLLSSRLDEGKKLIKNLSEHKKSYVVFFSKVEALKETYQDSLKEKLLKKVSEYKEMVGVEDSRLLQEVVYYLEKLDVDEEINRIHSHLEKLDSLLQSSGEVGRQIDFIVQELNRETNTIGSKSGHAEISDNVVQMKVQLEKIREQALNLE